MSGALCSCAALGELLFFLSLEGVELRLLLVCLSLGKKRRILFLYTLALFSRGKLLEFLKLACRPLCGRAYRCGSCLFRFLALELCLVLCGARKSLRLTSLLLCLKIKQILLVCLEVLQLPLGSCKLACAL